MRIKTPMKKDSIDQFHIFIEPKVTLHSVFSAIIKRPYES